MPTLNWIGKEAVVNHHQRVPFHLLKDVPNLACGDPGSGNLIVQGDNLVALKALLPYYAGQVKCIYIDPPYNTGNEGWAYNDNVNSPAIRKWLGEVVGKEGETLDRHDRWLCMMYPRLALLRLFLKEEGALFASIDDNEITYLRLALDQVFGQNNFCAQVTIQCNPKGRVLAQEFAKTHEYVLVYSRTSGGTTFELPKTLDDMLSEYDEVGADGRRFRALELRNTHRQFNKATRPNLHFPLYANPETGAVVLQSAENLVEIWPNWPDGMLGCWTWDRMKCREDSQDLVGRCIRGSWKVFRKAYATDESGDAVTKKPKSIWLEPEVQTEKGQRQIDEILGGRVFYAPKAADLVRRCVELVTQPGDLILDSFAGSGTTGHAVFKLNAVNATPATQEAVGSPPGLGLRQPSGAFPPPDPPVALEKRQGTAALQDAVAPNQPLPRRFILVEMESKIARDITAERVRRVAEGYTNAKGERVAGLGGGFRFCELGDQLFDERGKINAAVRFADLARHVYFTETGEPLPERVGADGRKLSSHVDGGRSQSLLTSAATKLGKTPLIAVHRGRAICLLYNGILKDKSPDGGNALTQSTLAVLREACAGQSVDRMVVYGTSQRLSPARLKRENVDFKQIPYSIRTT